MSLWSSITFTKNNPGFISGFDKLTVSIVAAAPMLLNHTAALEHSLDVLRKARFRVTGPRAALLELLVTQHGPFTMEDLHQKLKARKCDLVTIYRCLSRFESLNLVRRCDFGDGVARYEFSGNGEHHHHIICKKCRQVENFEDCVIEGLEKLVRRMGYQEISHALEFFGICPSCSRKTV